jgi:IMP dehydrogenase
MNIIEGLTFDDVLLVPKYSLVGSRSEIDISASMGDYKFNHPIIPANMKTITGREMALEVSRSGGLSILHRFMPIEDQFEIAKDMIDEFGLSKQFAVSVGIKNEDKLSVNTFYEIGVRIFCIDIAHGDSAHCESMTKWMKETYPDIFLIAGNIATREGARRLWLAGADAVKVGIGPGSLCTTRIETGNGVPQLTALEDVYNEKTTLRKQYWCDETRRWKSSISREIYIIADGGIKSAGDIVKALCFSDMVMAGNLFAGCVETPGTTLLIDGHSYKEYAGSSTHKNSHKEGVVALVNSKGRFQDVLTKLLEGLRSGCSYQGARNLTDLRVNPTFVKITSAGLKESHPHDVIVK